MVNRRRWHLLELCPELERSTGRGAFNRARVLDRRRLVEPRTKRITGGQPSRKAKNHASIKSRRRSSGGGGRQEQCRSDHGRRGRLEPARRQPGEPTEGMVHMIVIGADTHKRSHALAAVDEGTGRARGGREIEARRWGASGRGPLGQALGRRADGSDDTARRPITLPVTGVSWVNRFRAELLVWSWRSTGSLRPTAGLHGLRTDRPLRVVRGDLVVHGEESPCPHRHC
jgi:hypothetical protein